MHDDGFRIPDRVFHVFSWLVLLGTWAVLIYFYHDLPARVPIHFGFSGQPDGFADRSIWSVFGIGIIQLAITLLLLLVYRYPTYANIPGSLLLPMLPDGLRQMVIRLIRHMIVMISLLVNLTFATVSLMMISSAFGLAIRGLNWLLLVLLGWVILLATVYSIWMFRLTKAAIKQAHPNLPTI